MRQENRGNISAPTSLPIFLLTSPHLSPSPQPSPAMSQPNGTPTPQPASQPSGAAQPSAPRLPAALDADISALAALLSTGDEAIAGAEADTRELSDADVAALLRQLERADGVARGVESRLDDILDGLDGLLGDLGRDGTPAENGGTGKPSQ